MRKLLPWLLLAVFITGCGGGPHEEGDSGTPEEVSGAFNQAPSEFTYSLESADVPELPPSTFLALTEGEAKVSGGRASYQIPIELPPTVNNHAPDLSLNYSSGNKKSGHIGVGWSIGGLSSIYRCSASYAVDGDEAKKSNPQYSNGDRLCIDGQRLVVESIPGSATDAEYWSSRVTYITERDSSIRIKPINGHSSFQMFMKDGQRRYYGHNREGQNSRVYRAGDEGGDIKAWALDGVVDSYGNDYSIYYDFDAGLGEHKVNYIQLTPEVQVRFSYSDRDADHQLIYDAGNANRITKKLDAITTYIGAGTGPSGGTAVREYAIEYEQSPTTHRLLVDTVTECGFSSGGSQNCAQPLEFDWQAGELGFEQDAQAILSCAGEQIPATFLVDVNNDGLSDALTSFESVFPGSGAKYVDWYLFTGTETGCYEEAAWFNRELNRHSAQYIKPVRTHNGLAFLGSIRILTVNGRESYYAGGLLTPNFSAGTVNLSVIPGPIVLPNGARTFRSESGAIEVLDLNNDGLDDFWFAGSVFLQDPETGGFGYDFDDNYVSAPHPNAGMIAMDVNTDGLMDLVGVVENSGEGNASTVFSVNKGGLDIEVGVAAFPSSQTEVYTGGMISHGDLNIHFLSLFNAQRYPSPIFNAYGDFNGDGLKDVALHRNGTWWVRLGTGTGFTGPIDTGAPAASLKNQYFFAFDYNKDGKDDLIAQQDSGADAYVWRVLTSRIDGESVAFDVGSSDPFHGESPLTKVQTPVEAGSIFRGDFNNDGVMDFYKSGVVGLWSHRNPARVFYGKVQAPDLLASVTDGFGKTLAFEYSTLTSEDHAGEPFYTPDADGSKYVYPYTRPGRGMQVVKTLSESNGVGGTIDTHYHYAGGKIDLSGRGFLGFDEIRKSTPQQDRKTVSRYHLDWPFTGMIAEAKESDIAGTLISTQSFRYEAHEDNARFVYPAARTEVDYQLQATPIRVTTVENRYDIYGGLEYQRSQTGTGIDGMGQVTGLVRSSLTHNVLANDPDHWLMGFVTQSSVAVSSGPLGWTIPEAGESTEVWHHSYEALPGTLDVRQKNTYVGTDVETEVVYARDGNTGVITAIEQRARDINGLWTADRIQTFSDFDSGLFPRTVTNEAGHVSTITYDRRFGGQSKVVDANGLVTTTVYDPLGRVRRTIDPTQTKTDVVRLRCDDVLATACPESAVFQVATRVTHSDRYGAMGTPLTITFLDALQREVRTQTYGPNGVSVKQDTVYTTNGRIGSVSEPFTGMSPDYQTSYTNYNALGEALTVTQPDGGETTTVYTQDEGWLRQTQTLSIVDSMSTMEQVTLRYLDALGQLRRTMDADDVVTELTYDLQGNLASTIINGDMASLVTVGHDVAGNKTFLHDPATGPIQFSYNGFGELREQTWQPGTAQAKSITYGYDALGRQTSRTDTADGASASFTWVYDTLKKGYLTSEMGNGVTRTYSYNDLTQVRDMTETITGASATFDYTYDAFGRLSTRSYPSGLVVKQLYDASGVHARTLNISDPESITVLWALGEELDSRGHYLYQWYGNGVATGFERDPSSGRLTGLTTGKAGSSLSGLQGDIQSLGFSWDSNGNLQSRSSARTNAAGTAQEDLSESFTYDDLNRLDTATTVSGAMSSTVDYDYDAFGNLINNHLGVLEYEQSNGASLYGVTAAGGNTYGYDAYGNVTNLGSRTAQYDVFNKPTRIGDSQFTYGPSHEKVKTVSGGKTTYHYDGGSYLVESAGGSETVKAYVDGHYLQETSAGATTKYYLHFDHLGSVEAISDASGAFVTRMSFDAYGNRRNSDWTASASAASDYVTDIGFTGHDMVDEEGLVHMGGRVYDPSLGRFLSADLYVHSPDNSQSYNRYSYVHNNPLSFVDPTGYEPCDATVCEELVTLGHRDGSTGLTGMDALNFLNGMEFYNSGPMMSSFGMAGGGFNASASEVGKYFEHFEEYESGKIMPDPLPNKTKKELELILDSPVGDKIKRAGQKIKLSLSLKEKDAFVVDNGVIYYTENVDGWVKKQAGDRVEGDELDSATLGSLLAHEIGHIIGERGDNEIWTVKNYENAYRSHYNMPLRRSYLEVNDVIK